MMDLGGFSISTLIAGFIYGTIGVYIIKRARDTANIANFIIGIALLVYPFFISNAYAVWGIGAVLVAVAYKLA